MFVVQSRPNGLTESHEINYKDKSYSGIAYTYLLRPLIIPKAFPKTNKFISL